MNGPRHGFTMIELVIVLLIGGILTSIALAGFNNARGPYAVRGARDSFVALHARARAHAIELGENIALNVSSAGDSASINRADGTLIESIRFDEERNVELLPAGTSFRLCLSPRGFADVDCNSFQNTTVTVEFWHNADSTRVEILPMGQVIY